MFRLLVVAVLLISLTPASAYADESPSYSGAVSCKACHQGTFQEWQNSHHDLALQQATETTILGDFSGTEFRYENETMTFYQDGSAFFIKATQADGSTQTMEVVHTFGVTPLQQYLVKMPGGRLQALPYAWDARLASEGGQRWFHLYEDEEITLQDRLHWTQPLMNWNGMCADCHSTNLVRGYDSQSNSFNTHFKEEDVACESCHGPAGNHAVMAAQGDGSKTLAPELISFLKRLDGNWELADGASTTSWHGAAEPTERQGEIEICAACHSRRSPLTDGFTPDKPYLDQFRPALIEPGLYHADGQIRDEVYVYGSFIQSKMYAEGVTCSDCHNPHTLKLRYEGNAVCTQCHVAETYEAPTHHRHMEGSTGAQCANCHMPETTYMTVDPRRDHSIRIPRPDMSVRFGTPNACTTCHTDQTDKWAAEQTESWFGTPQRTPQDEVTAALHRAWQGDPSVRRTLRALANRSDISAMLRASVLAALQGMVDQETVPVLESNLNHSDPLIRFGAIRATEGLPAEVRAALLTPLLYDPLRANRSEAARLLADIDTALIPNHAAEALASATAEYMKTSEGDLWRGEGAFNIGLLHERKGSNRQATEMYHRSLEVDPYFTPSRINLAALVSRTETLEGGLKVLEEGLEAQPIDPELNHAYGLQLVRLKKYEQAMGHLKTAYEQAPENARYAYVYGTALNSLGQQEAALPVYRDALKAQPSNVDALYALATIHLSRGERSKAMLYARKLRRILPGDASIQQLIDGIRR